MIRTTALALLLAASLAACDGDDGTPTPVPASPGPTISATPTGQATPSPTPSTTATVPPATSTPAPTGTPLPRPEASPLAPDGLSAADLRATLDADLEDPSSPFRQAMAPVYAAGLPSLAGQPYYLIDAVADPDAGIVRLRETIAYTNITGAPLDALYLRVYANAPYFRDRGAENVRLASVLLDGAPVHATLAGTVLTVPFAAPLAPGADVRVDIALEQALPRLAGAGGLGSLFGAGDGNYGLYGVGGGILSLGHWYPSIIAGGHEGSPPLDFVPHGDISFAEAAFYRVRLDLPAGYHVAGSGLQVAGATEAGRYVTEWAIPAAREAAFLASAAFESREVIAEETLVRVAFPAGTAPGTQEVLLQGADAALQVFGDLFGPYAYADLDVVVGPLQGGASGMEFSGLVVIDDDLVTGAGADALDLGALFSDPELQAAFEEFFGDLDLSALVPGLGAGDATLEFVLAHEAAHQWWFGAVGSDSIRHPWMDESLTNYSAVLYFEQRYGPARAAEVESLFLAGAYTSGRTFAPDAVVDRPVAAFDALQYSGIVYGKGALFYRALREAVGDGAFFAGLRKYHERYRFRIAPNGAPVQAIRGASSDPDRVDRLYARWIEGTHGDEDIGAPALPGDLTDLASLLDLLNQLLEIE